VLTNRKGTPGSGTFAISPSKEGSEAAKNMREKTKTKNKLQLQSMGFEEFLIEKAVCLLLHKNEMLTLFSWWKPMD